VNIGPSYTTQRQEALDMLMELVKTMPQLSASIADLVVENMDVPGADKLIERIKRTIPPGIRDPEPGEPPPPEPPPDPMIELKKQELALKEAELKLKALDSKSENNRKTFEAKMKAIVDILKVEMPNMAANMDEAMGLTRGFGDTQQQQPAQQPKGPPMVKPQQGPPAGPMQ